MAKIDVKNDVTPTTPPSGYTRIYAKSDKILYYKDDTGVETAISAVSNEQIQDAVGSILTDTSSVDLTYDDGLNTISAAVLPAGVNHNSLLNYVSNQHIDHSSVSIVAGTGLTGGGDLTASRTLSLPSVGTPGTYKSVTTDAQGRVTAGTNPTSLAGYGITDAQPLDADLTALAGLSTTGIVCRTAANTFETRFIAVSTGLGASEPAGVGGNPTLFIANTGVTPGVYGSSSSVPQITVGSTGQVSLAANVSITPAGIGAQPADGDLTALANLAGTGFITRTAANTMANRTLVAGTGVLISNGDGISGNPSISSNITLTPPPLQNLSDAASAGVSTELARADHTHGFNVSGVTPGTYGDALNYPIITVNSQGQVTAASSQPLAPSGWQELINLSTITNTSNVTFVSITDLAITVTVGRRYRIEGQIIYRTAATTTGVGISLGAFSDGFSTAAGTVVGAVQTAIGSTGTAATYSGSITSLFNAVTSTSVSAANTDYLIELNAVFTCTASGLIIPIFRSEVNGSTVTVGIGSNLIAREFV